MKKTTAVVVAVMLPVTILLAGCGGGAKPDSSPTSTGASPTVTTLAPTTVAPTSPQASPTTAVPKTDPNIPAAARARTPAGAEAFVSYFYAQLNVAWATPRAGLVSALSAPACKTCANFEREAAKSVTKNERVVGPSIVLTTVDTSDATNPAKMTVLAIGYQPKTLVVDATGKTVQTLQRERVKTQVTVQWDAAGWRLSEIQSVA